MSAERNLRLMEITAHIVAAYVCNNVVRSMEVGQLIEQVHQSLLTQIAPPPVEAPSQPPQKPAVPVKKSVMPDYIICLEDGKRLKYLKSYLLRVYGLSPDEYRAKWHLPRNYPMVAPSYAALRSDLAKKQGLGIKAQSTASKVKRKKKATG